jgi:hypothetical protein
MEEVVACIKALSPYFCIIFPYIYQHIELSITSHETYVETFLYIFYRSYIILVYWNILYFYILEISLEPENPQCIPHNCVSFRINIYFIICNNNIHVIYYKRIYTCILLLQIIIIYT